MTRNLLLSMLICFVAASTCAAGTVTQTKGNASVEIRWDSSNRALALSDLITVTVIVAGPAPLPTPAAPLGLPADAKWQLVQRSRPVREVNGAKERWQLTYLFAPREPGKLQFLFPPVKYRGSDGVEELADWEPIEFDVAIPPLGELRDITSIETLPPLPPPGRGWLIGVILLVSLIGFLILAAGMRRWLQARKVRTPIQAALDAVNRLAARRLPETGRGNRFVLLLTMIVRRYLERQFPLPAQRRTTPEFLRELEACQALTSEEKSFLSSFFVRCETVKYGKGEMLPDECARWLNAVGSFLEQRART